MRCFGNEEHGNCGLVGCGRQAGLIAARGLRVCTRSSYCGCAERRELAILRWALCLIRCIDVLCSKRHKCGVTPRAVGS